MAAVVSRGRRGRRAIAEMNMVPFIDVMLVLLIIFMVTAPLITTGLVELPSVGKAANRPKSCDCAWTAPTRNPPQCLAWQRRSRSCKPATRRCRW